MSLTGFSELPADVLHDVFVRVLSGPSELEGAPLKAMASQWFALRLTCRHWASVLQRVIVGVDLESASPAALSWLARLPVRTLRIGRFGSLRDRRSKSAPALANQAGSGLEEELGPAVLLASLLHSSGGGSSPLWRLADFSQLQVLHLKGVLSPSGEPCSFSTAPLAALARLTHLHLERFTHYDLSGLPSSVRTLRLRYQEAPMFSSQPHPSLDIPRLPPATRLSLLELDSRAALGLVASELLPRCEAVLVRATRAYVGVHGPFDPLELIWGFHTTANTPAQLRRKAALMDVAAQQLVALLAGEGAGAGGVAPGYGGSGGSRGEGEAEASPPQLLLRTLKFQWMCANTLVFVPLPQQRAPERDWPQAGAYGRAAAGQLGGGVGGRSLEGDAWAEAVSALESAQAAVHEGEDPVVEVPAARVAELAAQQAEQGASSCAVHAEYAAGHQAAMFLHLVRRPKAGQHRRR